MEKRSLAIRLQMETKRVPSVTVNVWPSAIIVPHNPTSPLSGIRHSRDHTLIPTVVGTFIVLFCLRAYVDLGTN
eukprot:scaffold196547_cov26-Tisochrysis_lutea.AAC.1